MKDIALMLGLTWNDEKDASERFLISDTKDKIFSSVFKITEKDGLINKDADIEDAIFIGLLLGTLKIEKIPLNAIECDRCGRIYEENNAYDIMSICTANEDDKIVEEFYLCDDCLAEFYDWVKMG